MSSSEPKRKGLLGRMFGSAETPSDEKSAPSAEGAAEAAAAPSEAPRKSWLDRLRSGLAKTSSRLAEGITGLVTKKRLDQATLDELEEVLIAADLGIPTASRITQALAKGRFDKAISADEIRETLAEEVARVLEPLARPLEIDPARKPHVVLVLGVNGSGKTTTIGKLAARLAREGRSVMLAAGDTFRAAAIDQLKVWGERVGAPVIARNVGSDASGLAFDALKEAQAQAADVLLIDTAGRLQNKEGLMAELEKIVRVIRKVDPSAPHDVLLVLDATTGQNALQQVDVFRERAGVTGLIMTKLDGTARGGILVAIAAKHALPIHAIGVGESVDDLQSFSAKDYALAIAES
ncbi:MAG: signal recognition particle-docking protein FtsY [Hyphomicrobium sp.]|uniref:signal recognition particle-docking protein FtsY n=1 Tax=Hyphomicrobium sp. TaxID=82 RepID=UPI003D0A76C0